MTPGAASAPRWPAFFDAQAATYEENGFAAHTVAEVDFLLRILPLAAGATILDVGCATGRHAREFARRGYRPTGLDRSERMIEVAREKGPGIEFVRADARGFDLGRTFDAAVCLCEGGPGLIEAGEDPVAHDEAIFRSVARHLRPGAPFVVTALNGYAPIRRMTMQHVFDGQFDPATMRSRYEDVWDLPTGEETLRIEERLFIAPEMTGMLRRSGFEVDRVLGGTAGHWALRPLDLDEVEAMYVCRRAAGAGGSRTGRDLAER